MKYRDFEKTMSPFTVFSVNEIRQFFPDFSNRRLHEWQEKGYVKKLINRWYSFSEAPKDERALFLVANQIYQPSYVSLETALSYYGLIPETAFSLTSVTTLKTNKFETPLGAFIYASVKPPLFFGYQLLQAGGRQAKIADVEKTLLDYLYLRPSMATPGDFYEWRINKEELATLLDFNKLEQYLDRFQTKALEKRVATFRKFLSNA